MATGRTTRRKKPENAGYLDRTPTEVHVGFAEYITTTTGHTVPEGDVALVLRLYPVYLKSPAVVAAREEQARLREEAARAKEQEKQDRLKKRLAKIEADRQRVLAELGIEDGTVIDAADRFTNGDGITIEETPDEEESDEDDFEVGAVEVEAEDEFVVESDDDDDDWDDDEDDEEDF